MIEVTKSIAGRDLNKLVQIVNNYNRYQYLLVGDVDYSQLLLHICDMIKGNQSLVENLNFYFLTPLSHSFKTLQSYERFVNAKKQYKTKESDHCFCQYLKNNMANIQLIPLDHVTYGGQLKC